MNILKRLGIQYKNPRWWFDVFIIAMTYYIVSWLVLKKMPVSPYGTPVWPGTGLVVGLLLLWGRSRWLGIFLGATLTNMIMIRPLWLGILGGTGTAIGSLISVTLILRLIKTNYFLNQVNHVAIFSFCSVFTGTVLQSLIGVMAVCLAGHEPWSKCIFKKSFCVNITIIYWCYFYNYDVCVSYCGRKSPC